MSDISRVVMDALRKQLTELELDAVLIRGRIEQQRATIQWLENGERPRGRPRAVSALNPYPSQNLQQALNTPHMPLRTKGGVACAETDLPSLDDVRGILTPPDPPEAA